MTVCRHSLRCSGPPHRDHRPGHRAHRPTGPAFSFGGVEVLPGGGRRGGPDGPGPHLSGGHRPTTKPSRTWSPPARPKISRSGISSGICEPSTCFSGSRTRRRTSPRRRSSPWPGRPRTPRSTAFSSWTGPTIAGALLAEAYARKVFAECGAFSSGGWDPADTIRPEVVPFAVGAWPLHGRSRAQASARSHGRAEALPRHHRAG